MPKIAFTIRALDGLAENGPDGFHWDEKQPGLGLRRNGDGHLFFVVDYRVKGTGKRRRMALGRYGTVTLEEARERARKVVSDGRDGRDAIEEQRVLAARVRFGALVDLWIDERVKPTRKPRTAADYRAVMNRYLLPKFKMRFADELSRGEITRLHGQMCNTPKAANDMIAIGKACFNYGLKSGHIGKGAENPFTGIELYRLKGRERFLSEAELQRIGDAITSLLALNLLSPWSAAALRLLILTGARSAEIKELEWAHVDLNNGLLRLPDSKTGAKIIHLSEPALAVLQELPKVRGNPHVIVGQKPGAHMISLRVPWERVCQRAEIVGCRVHDLRHTYASLLAASGASLFTIGKLLGHKVPATTQRYAHLADDFLKRANAGVGDKIGSLLTKPEETPKPAGEGTSDDR